MKMSGSPSISSRIPSASSKVGLKLLGIVERADVVDLGLDVRDEFAGHDFLVLLGIGLW